jgi:hypothetical protein
VCQEEENMDDLFPATTALLSRLRAQPEVLGVCLLGSKSRGYNDKRSDDDLEVILTHEAYCQRSPAACLEYYSEGGKLLYDARYLSLAHLQSKQSSSSDADHWPYERAQVLFDRYGTVKRAVEALSRMETRFRHTRIVYSTLSTTITIGKACKAFQRSDKASGYLTVTRGAKALARLLFALEWRWTPTDHWLEKELKTLKDPAGASSVLVQALFTADPLLLRLAVDQLEATFPDEVPDRDERAQLYPEVMHPTRLSERAVHLLI